MKTIFLESHHLKNLNFGFGQFNFHLVKALQKINAADLRFILHGQDLNSLKSEFGDTFGYKKYFSLRRYPLFRIREKYDLWHSLNQNTKIEPYHDIPYLLTVHDHPHIKDPSNYKEQEIHKAFQQKLNSSDAIVYISEFARDSTRLFYDIPKVLEKVIYNGNTILDVNYTSGNSPAYIPPRPFLFSIGVMDGRKNFDALINMMPFLPEMDLVIAGKDTTKAADNTKRLVEELGLESRVKLTGSISDCEKHYYYRNSTAFVFPSTREGFGLPVIEAMKFGKPVFLSDKTSLPEIGGEAGIYWEHFEPEYMAEVLTSGIQDYDADRENISKKLISRADDFCWNSAAKAYCDVYRHLLY